MHTKPNILWLFSDQHSARTLGCYGNREVHTPNLDRLAAQGVRLTNAYTQNPICTPSRMCYLSGQYVHNFGYFGNKGHAPARLPHLLSHVRKHGYKTGVFGKLHTPQGWLGPHCDVVMDPSGIEGADPYGAFLRELGKEADRDDKFLPAWYAGHGANRGQGVDAQPSKLNGDETLEGWLAERTGEFIESAHRQGSPFCVWMTLSRPHQPYAAARSFWDMYDERALTLPPNADHNLAGRHASAKLTQRHWQTSNDWRLFQPDDWETSRRRVLRGYYACVSQVDYACGKVLNKLEQLGIRDNTIVVYASDHGEFAGEHGMIEKAPGIAFRCVTRIPYIWSYPKALPANVSRDNLTGPVDFLPTVCALAGLPQPDWTDGRNITEALTHGRDVNQEMVTEFSCTKTIHTKTFKLTQYIPDMCEGNDFGELYDIRNDPWELRNLYFDGEYKPIVEELRFRLYCWLVRTTRHVTVGPKAPGKREPWSGAWHAGHEWYGEDGKIGFEPIQAMIERGQLNYL